MITISGYKQIEYVDLAQTLYEYFLDSGKKEIQIATELGLDSPNTIRNAFHPTEQRVSDKALTGVMKSVGLNGTVVWENGTRQYYTSIKKTTLTKQNT